MSGGLINALRIALLAYAGLLVLLAAGTGKSLGGAARLTDAPPLAASPATESGTPTMATPAAATPIATPVAHRSVSVNGTVTIQLTDAGFEPDYVQSTNGHDLTITLVNTGTRPHGFRIDGLGVQAVVPPGHTATVRITSPPLGDFTYISGEPGDTGMQGELTFYI